MFYYAVHGAIPIESAARGVAADTKTFAHIGMGEADSPFTQRWLTQ